MVDFGKMKLLSEAATGFTGGSYVDEMPDVGLFECASSLPVTLLEYAVDLADLTSEHNNALVEAATSAISLGSTAEDSINAISEASLEGLKAKAKSIFDAILRFLNSIINKLKTFIDKKFKSGHQMYEKYKDHPNIKNASATQFENMAFDGYKFGEAKFAGLSKYLDNVEALVNASTGLTLNPNAKLTMTDDKYADHAKKAEGIDKKSSSDVVLAAAKILSGKSDLSDDWVGGLKKDLYGEKVALKYGSDYTMATVTEVLKNSKNIVEVMDDYKKLQRYTLTFRDELIRNIDSTKSDDKASKKETGEKPTGNKLAYSERYLTAVNAVYSAVTKVSEIRMSFENAKYEQNTRLFNKMLTHKAGKAEKDTKDEKVDEAFGEFGEFADLFI